MNYTTTSEQQTKEIAARLAPTLSGGTILCLHGDLGAGKTTFVKGLAAALGIADTILSPTFTLMNVYKTDYGLQTTDYGLRTTDYGLQTTKTDAVVRSQWSVVKQLVHIDTYRLKDENELVGIGAMDYIGEPDMITVIEWPEKIASLLKNIRQRRTSRGPEKVINITFTHDSATTRKIDIDD